MKKVTLLFVIASVMSLNVVSAQDSWVQKADVGGWGRYRAVAFSINGKGYVGTGYAEQTSDSFLYVNDFWEYNPATNAWTQKADFAGPMRNSATGFAIGDKGYVGTGYNIIGGNNTTFKDFWEYDPSSNTWTQKANFGGVSRYGAVGFAIGDKGYIGTGRGESNGYKYDFWQYDPALDHWIQKSNFPGTGRRWAVGFSIGNSGYIGTGSDANGLRNDFYEYDPATDTWTQKASFAGTARYGAVAFSIGSKGYIGTGQDLSGYYVSLKTDLWQYDPSNDSWIQKADFPGVGREEAIGFATNDKGYIGTGEGFYFLMNDFYEYTPNITCVIPPNLSSTNITSTSAKLKWDVVAGAESYKVRYKVANTSVWTNKNATGTSKIISGLSPNTEYKWEVKTYCNIDSPSVSSDWSPKQSFTTTLRLADEQSPQPSFQLYPNPAEDHATIQFTLPQSSHITIKVYDASGKEIAVLLNDDLDEGEHSLPINTLHFPKQVYLVQLISDFGIETQKLIVQ